MPTTLDKYWNLIVDGCKERIAKNKKAGIKSVISALKQAGKIPNDSNPTHEDIHTIEGLITFNGKFKSTETEDDIFIIKDFAFRNAILSKTVLIITTVVSLTSLTIQYCNFKINLDNSKQENSKAPLTDSEKQKYKEDTSSVHYPNQ